MFTGCDWCTWSCTSCPITTTQGAAKQLPDMVHRDGHLLLSAIWCYCCHLQPQGERSGALTQIDYL